ncbi:MAG TPA: EamA family transporter [Stellaceae bacterium]|nr:EamA family transporter [Stellaceae bacterium]
MTLFDLAALAAALCVAFSNLIAPPAVRHFGSFAFNRWRQAAALVVLCIMTSWRGGWSSLSRTDLAALTVSAIVGIVAGDSAVYACMARLGPRRAAILYATNAPFAALLGFLLLDETLSIAKCAGIAAVITGVWIAIAYRDANPRDALEEIRGRISVGIGFGLLGGLAQAVATLIARPIMAAGTDPVAAASIRSAAALLGLLGLSILPGFRGVNPPSLRMSAIAALSGLIGMGAGMTLILFALSGSPTGVVNTLASTTPVLLLPMLWMASGARPTAMAWFGAALSVVGIAILSGGFL